MDLDWNDEDLWDKVDEGFGVRDLEPALRAFLAYLISIGWTPPMKESGS